MVELLMKGVTNMARRLKDGTISNLHPLWLVGALLLSGAAGAAAAERSAPLLSGEDLLGAGTAGITQGGATGSSGSLLYPEQILAVDVEAAQPGGTPDARVQAWSKVYRFIVVPLNIAVRANPGTKPQSVIINATFRNIGQLSKQPIIVDIFPGTGFKAEPIKGEASASIGVGADLKFGSAPPANASASAKAALSYTYNPAFANVQTGFASSAGFWQFVATQQEQPVGALPLKLTVGIPRAASGPSVTLAVDAVVKFGSAWWGDEVRASFVSEVLLTQN